MVSGVLIKFFDGAYVKSCTAKRFCARMMDTLIVRIGSTYYYDADPYDAQFQTWGYVKLTEAEWTPLIYP